VDAVGVPMVHRTRLRAVIIVAALLSACHFGSGQGGAPQQSNPDNAVVVAAFNFPESKLLAEIYSQALEHSGMPVRRQFDLGPRELVQPAQRQGFVDVVPEYLGSALTGVAPNVAVDLTDSSAVLAALRTALRPWKLEALQPAPASDQNGFAVTRATADRLRLRTLSDLAAESAILTLGGPSECPTRRYCMAGLQRVYGMQFKRFLAFDDESQRAAALTEGVIDVAVTFTTNGQLATGKVVLLMDDRKLQPAEQVVPVVSSRVVQTYGARLVDTLNAVSVALDTPGLLFLNWRVTVAQRPFADEAHGWLERHRLVPP